MNIKTTIFCVSALFFLPVVLRGQFYTVKSDSMRISPHPLIKQRQKIKVKKDDSLMESKKQQTEKLAVSHLSIRQDSVSKRSSPEERINPLFKQLEERLNVCLPLDILQISSRFGSRIDPFTRCRSFHDGIDLICKRENVYAMLPAVVTKVHYGSKGYGNYVILTHGRLECLYGHLDKITVREKEEINAGTIIGISGNTGKSTNYHLHIRLRNHGRSIDPLGFLGVLRAYIRRLNEGLSMVVPKQQDEVSAILSQNSLYAEIVRKEILFPKVVLAQALLETGYFTSRVCLEYNNLFGLRRRNGEYMQFERWEESVAAYRDYVQYKYKGGDYFDFLDRIGYAEDKYYTTKVRLITQGLKKMENS